MKINQIVKAKESFEPLWKKGDKFVIVQRNKDENLMEIEAMKLKSHKIYGFDENELECLK